MSMSEDGLTRALVAAWKEVEDIKKERESNARCDKLKAEWDAMRNLNKLNKFNWRGQVG